MKQRFLWLGLVFLGPVLMLGWWGRQAAADPFSAPLPLSSDALPLPVTNRFIIYLSQQITFDLEALPTAKVARRQAVVAQLQAFAAASQATLRRELQNGQTQGQITRYQPLWVVNAIIVEGNAAAIASFSTHPDVARIIPDTSQQYLLEPATLTGDDLTTAPGWGTAMIRAAQTWYGLGIDGTGVVIAIMDSGVDWQHPALVDRYRGTLSGTHEGNWFDVVDGSATPIDPYGHGTHVTGIAVGAEGIGVAPGATWIAVRMLNATGNGYVSEIHQAFQWLLAPGGNPALAPDLVNASWGATDMLDTAFQGDIQALHAAAILPIFAAGNSGPNGTSLTSPASLPDVFAVGATDSRDEVTWFSSRGPSPLTNEIKPDIVAPGGGIYATLPGGRYGYYSGTSMATPHVVGAAALLLSANPTLSRTELRQLLRDTAVPLYSPSPNHLAGYGRLDVYAAATSLVAHGILTGQLTPGTTGAPSLAGAVITITTPGGEALPFYPDETGQFRAWLKAGTYQMTVAPFGYMPLTVTNVVVQNGVITTRNLIPTALPFAVVSGVVRDQQGQPISATITAEGTPIRALSGSDGVYEMTLPAGSYELLAAANGYRLRAFTVSVPTSQLASFILSPAPTILLVNDGTWHYQNYYATYAQSLTDAGYTFTYHPIYNPYGDVPTLAQLQAYDVVIWASPRHSPGTIAGGVVLSAYLDEGGYALVFGPNVGETDGGGIPDPWWSFRLRGTWLGRQTPPFNLTGVAGTPFAGLSFNLNGSGSAAAHSATDRVQPAPGSLTEPILTYGDGSAAALQAGLCDPHQIVYLGFGLEAVGSSLVRRQLVERSFTWFQTPTTTVGGQFFPTQIEALAIPGTTHRYTITLHNLSEIYTDTFSLSLPDATWTASLLTPTLTLGPCQTGQTVVELTMPTDEPPDTRHTMVLQAQSVNTPTYTRQMAFHHKTPGVILLVDDDRFFDVESNFQAALTANGLVYDVWETGVTGDGLGSPPAALLPYYDMIFWFTGYDWFEPITSGEVVALTQYLAQGGRLFLSSQDYLYFHSTDPLTRDYLGVRDYWGEAAPTLVMADGLLRAAGLSEPLPVDVTPYQNFGDGLIPQPGLPVVMWQDTGLPGAVMNEGVAVNGATWRTMFWSFPWEKLPLAAQTPAMNGIIGWLSDWGGSTFEADELWSASGGSTHAFTITVRNDGELARTVTAVNTISKFLEIDLSSVTGGAVYEPLLGQLVWQGVVAPGGEKVIHYVAAAAPHTAPGSFLFNQLTLYDHQHVQGWKQILTVQVGTPDWRRSALTVWPAQPVRGQPMTYTLALHNQSAVTAPVVSSTLFLPLPLTPITATLGSSSGVVTITAGAVNWQGSVAPGQTVTVSLVLTATDELVLAWLGAAAIIADQQSQPFLITHLVPLIPPYAVYLPMGYKPYSPHPNPLPQERERTPLSRLGRGAGGEGKPYRPHPNPLPQERERTPLSRLGRGAGGEGKPYRPHPNPLPQERERTPLS
ncbi:MAG: S8 family serine peptidase, partial [Chloroflexi bacterium]|nr:S8 family serine peptidase [Chloroflexota bacterium]